MTHLEESKQIMRSHGITGHAGPQGIISLFEAFHSYSPALQFQRARGNTPGLPRLLALLFEEIQPQVIILSHIQRKVNGYKGLPALCSYYLQENDRDGKRE
jgi:hypothetical protein